MRVYLKKEVEEKLGKEFLANVRRDVSGELWKTTQGKFLKIKFDGERRQYYVELETEWTMITNDPDALLHDLVNHIDEVTLWEMPFTLNQILAGIYEKDEIKAFVHWAPKEGAFLNKIHIKGAKSLSSIIMFYKNILQRKEKPAELLEPESEEG